MKPNFLPFKLVLLSFYVFIYLFIYLLLFFLFFSKTWKASEGMIRLHDFLIWKNTLRIVLETCVCYTMISILIWFKAINLYSK